MLDMSLSPAERAAAGRQLADLGDHRPGVGLRSDGLPDIVWCEVPAGEFIYQDDERVELPTFYIAKYPITCIQYSAFISAEDGFNNDKWRQGLAEHRRESGEQLWHTPNRPRENVNWYDAIAFCRWLTTKFNLEIRLPTELEWEKAARGVDGRIYPWGNTYIYGYANVDETHANLGPNNLEWTTAVGIYPAGTSPYGVLDMSGNIWEWTAADYGNGQESSPLNRVRRVIRGGAYDFYANAAQTFSRFDGDPSLYYNNVGFRVATSDKPK